MKKISVLLLAGLMCLTLCACGGFDAEEIDDALQGRWSYSWYASAIGKQCLSVYEFDDGEVKQVTVRGGVEGDVQEGTYEISEDKIIVTFDGYDEEFEYTFEDGDITLVRTGDGSVKDEYKRFD